MNITVFGGSGFLGSHVADCLTQQGHKVTVFDLQPSSYLTSRQRMIVGNILDSEAVARAVVGADFVYNFAGIADIDIAKSQPIETIETNVMGNIYILDACRHAKVKRFVFASTVYVYSSSGSFYRASKQSCELFIEAYQKKFGLDFTILRYGSLYGPRADKNNWVYSVIHQALIEKKIQRKGNGEEIREYIHVRDAAELTMRMLDEKYSNQYVIITGQQHLRVKDVLIMIREMLGNNIELEFLPTDQEEHYEVTPYHFQPKFARKLTDSSYVDLGQGLIELINMEYEKMTQASPLSSERI